MKKTSILSLLWLAGLLTFVATPTFAQEAEEDLNTEDTVAVEAVVEDAAENTEDVAEDVETSDEAIAETSDTSFEDAIKNDPEAVENLNVAMDEFLSGLELSEEDRAEFEANFATPEDRAVAAAALWTLFAGAGIIYLIVAWIWSIILIIALWIIFKKAGEKGWKAIIPIWNVYIMFKIAGMKNWFWWMILGSFIICLVGAFAAKYQNIASIIAAIWVWIINIVAAFKLPRKFGWGVFTSILYVLFTPICQLILGFGSSKYQGNKED